MNIGALAVKNFKLKMYQTIGKMVQTAFNPKHLLYTNIGISFCLSGCGDVLEQRYEILTQDLDKWDKKRTFNMSVTGLTIGVICHYWYKFLDRSLPGYKIRIVVKKVVIDQMIFSPICIFTFFSTLSLLEGMTYNEFIHEVKKKAWKLYVAEWVVWPTAQFVNFYLLPHRYRVLYDNTISLGYDVYTSHVANFDKLENLKSDKS